MSFLITIKHDRKTIRLKVELIETTKETEKFKVIARNQSFTLQSNRPMIRAKGLKHFPVTWKVIEGGYHQQHILDLIIKQIENKIV